MIFHVVGFFPINLKHQILSDSLYPQKFNQTYLLCLSVVYIKRLLRILFPHIEEVRPTTLILFDSIHSSENRLIKNHAVCAKIPITKFTILQILRILTSYYRLSFAHGTLSIRDFDFVVCKNKDYIQNISWDRLGI